VKQDPIKQFFRDANPNPAREGCPSHDVIRAIAADTIPPNNPASLHLAECSPCFNEFLTFKETQKTTRRRNMTYAALAAAALLSIGLWTVKITESKQTPTIASLKQNGNRDTTPQQLQPAAATVYAISLAGISRTRGSPSGDEPKPTTIPARLLSLQITLPFGSDDGKYDIEIRKPGIDGPLVKTSGIARIIEGDTLLNISEVDLAHVPHGAYNLFFKHADASWQHAAILIE
jgi:hypothetical protein